MGEPHRSSIWGRLDGSPSEVQAAALLNGRDWSLSPDQTSGTDLGFINPGLYKIGSDSTRYAADFFDVTTGNNGAFAPTIPGYSASQGWDAVTGLGTPNAAILAPDLVAAVRGH